MACKKREGLAIEVCMGWGMGAEDRRPGFAHGSQTSFPAVPPSEPGESGQERAIVPFQPGGPLTEPVNGQIGGTEQWNPSAAGTGLTLVLLPYTAGQRDQSAADTSRSRNPGWSYQGVKEPSG